jgi:hypothetical protein
MTQAKQFPIIILEGLDRLGKSTLINNIMNHFGFYHYIHYEKPKALDCYLDSCVNPLKAYQVDSFLTGFDLIANATADTRIIFDRFHLGESVYSPLYRKYDGDYVFSMEHDCIEQLKVHPHKLDNVKLILLTSSNFDFVEDDGLSFDVTAQQKEQNMFIAAFNTSKFKHKTLIDVHNGHGGFKDPLEIFSEAFK